jgi:deoxyribodipyrimidine photolyase-related protein
LDRGGILRKPIEEVRMPEQPTTLRLVLGDQLNLQHSWWAQPRTDVVVVLMEVRQETDYVRHHAQKVLGIFAAMRAFAQQLQAQGHRVHYIAIDDPTSTHQILPNLEQLARHYQATRIEYQAPDEYRLDELLRAWAQQSTLHIESADTEHFLTARTDLARHFEGKKQWLMESFYRAMRKRLGTLMDAQGQPEGGQWNFDADNRKSYKGDPPPPVAARPTHDLSVLWATIQAAGIDTFGNPQAQHFVWPLNRDEALEDLQHFVTHSLPWFGDFQDALSSQSWRLFHSLLSFALNTKMLHPFEVVQAAEDAYRSGHAPLHAVEGFIRQIIGWREYVRGVYWAHMPHYTQHNALDHQAPLPSWFWTGRTHMACMASAIGQSLEHAYAHHIQRLMVIGNFALLAGINPQALHEWYLGVYIDAFEWVEAPNTLGMSQRADGGIIATKPYVSSAAYLKRMGDHCSQCHYKPTVKTGSQACPFNALYWDFFARHAGAFERNPRLGMVYVQLKRMAPTDLDALRHQAQLTIARLEVL